MDGRKYKYIWGQSHVSHFTSSILVQGSGTKKSLNIFRYWLLVKSYVHVWDPCLHMCASYDHWMQVYVGVCVCVCAFTQCSWPMQTLAANSGNDGSSGLILAHSLNTDTAPTPWKTDTPHAHTHAQPHTSKCQWQIVINVHMEASCHAASDDMVRF